MSEECPGINFQLEGGPGSQLVDDVSVSVREE